jgi:hypothetical protein
MPCCVQPSCLDAGLLISFLAMMQVSTLLVAPVAPHWAEEVWTAKLGRPGCVVTAGWPAAAEPDLVLQVPLCSWRTGREVAAP